MLAGLISFLMHLFSCVLEFVLVGLISFLMHLFSYVYKLLQLLLACIIICSFGLKGVAIPLSIDYGNWLSTREAS